MLYIVHARISVKNSFDIRKVLHQNDFTIYLENRLTYRFVEADEDYEGEESLPSIDEKTHVFDCIYNSRYGYPEQGVFVLLDTRKEVESYTIECRKKW